MGESRPLILVVEDEDNIRLNLRDYLVALDYEVIVASDGVGAIKHLLDHEVSLVVSDYRMDILGGDYWIRFLHHFCPNVKVIITSGFISPDISVPYEVLVKPYNFEILKDRVQSLLG